MAIWTKLHRLHMAIWTKLHRLHMAIRTKSHPLHISILTELRLTCPCSDSPTTSTHTLGQLSR